MSLLLKNIYKSFGSNIAVNDLTLMMDRPGIFGLIGTNGAGKTTAIRVTLGIMEQDSGTVVWKDGKLTRASVKFGYLPEERGLYMKYGVLEQLVYFAMLRGMNASDARNRAKRWLERFNIVEYSDVKAEKLSKGNQQKVQFIAAIIHDPELIFFDEPFSGLDPLNMESISELLHELANEQKFMIMSSHQMSTVEKFCDNILLMHKGHTLLSGNLKDIKASYGHTNLLVFGDFDALPEAKACGLIPRSRRPDADEYGISDDEQAKQFLSLLISAGKYPYRYEVREPSLHEIFVEKINAAENEVMMP